MNNPEGIKLMVREKYSVLVDQSKTQNENSCCGSGSCCGDVDYSIFSDSYDHLKGYAAEADLGLGCGLPTSFAMIKEGDTVIDLGSGAGNDCFVARAQTGASGKVIGIDMTEKMIDKAEENLRKLGYENVHFLLGDIEAIPLEANTVDVVVSNCVLNLVPDKSKAFAEIFRILKPAGHFSVSDIVLEGELPNAIQSAAEMYAGCVSGAIQKSSYLQIIGQSGFEQIKVQKEKRIDLPDELLLNYLSKEELFAFKNENKGIFSVTVYAEKPSRK